MQDENWYQKAEEAARNHPTINGLRSKAKWYRQQSNDFLNNSVNSMRQHEKEADWSEKTAKLLEMEMIAKAGVAAGEYKCYLVGRHHDHGAYIQVETDQGWHPDYFWCESPPEEVMGEGAYL